MNMSSPPATTGLTVDGVTPSTAIERPTKTVVTMTMTISAAGVPATSPSLPLSLSDTPPAPRPGAVPRLLMQTAMPPQAIQTSPQSPYATSPTVMTPPTPDGYRQDTDSIGVEGVNNSGFYVGEPGINRHLGDREHGGDGGKSWLRWFTELVDGFNETVLGWLGGDGSGRSY